MNILVMTYTFLSVQVQIYSKDIWTKQIFVTITWSLGTNNDPFATGVSGLR